MLIGYARTSTIEQDAGLEAQIHDLNVEGCEKLFSEQVSSVGKRVGLDEALNYTREGDILVVTRLDRLARSVSDLGKILDRLEKNGASLRILSLGGSSVDTASPTGRLMLHLLGAISEFERSIMLERQRDGIAKAKVQGKYKGRVPTVRRQASEILRLQAEGLGPTEIARRLSCGRASVYRVITEQAKQ